MKIEIFEDYLHYKFVGIYNRKLLLHLKKEGVKVAKPIKGVLYKHYQYAPLAVVASEENLKLYKKALKKFAPTPKKVLSEDEKIEKWAKRLAKLVNLELDEALEIAREKIDYHQKNINALIDKEAVRPSRARGKLIEKLQRANPLRYIKDTEHACNILSAHNRHENSDYEAALEEARYLRKTGEVEDIKEYAHINKRYK
jgi:hypothetical protein